MCKYKMQNARKTGRQHSVELIPHYYIFYRLPIKIVELCLSVRFRYSNFPALAGPAMAAADFNLILKVNEVSGLILNPVKSCGQRPVCRQALRFAVN